MFSSGITTDSVLLFVSIHSTNILIPNQRIKGEEEETFSYPEEKLVMLYSGSNIDPYFMSVLISGLRWVYIPILISVKDRKDRTLNESLIIL